jgi:hypothetical protein
MAGWIRMSGTLECDFSPVDVGFMKTEVIMWDGGDYYAGVPQYYLNEEWAERYQDLSIYPIQFLSVPYVRHLTITHAAIIKSAAPANDFSSGTLKNFTARITAT